ncbi:flagellar hook-length control protein FliK [Shewanella surugensis]|uniref:Flagellar hook-length control protein FliK n=1 Tax=Shewanella surugensis TaxID=212020 RepID=A0ABT0L9I1_9GAMM|nr:flagellar hook-length control protein FliK [Shewanella surugensis]MCL1124368.1 flagellar hook-length control protein FliK [Shewanella surugensis]
MPQMMNNARMELNLSGKERAHSVNPTLNERPLNRSAMTSGSASCGTQPNNNASERTDFASRLSSVVNTRSPSQQAQANNKNVHAQSSIQEKAFSQPEANDAAALENAHESAPLHTGEKSTEKGIKERIEKSQAEDEQVQHLLSQLTLATQLKDRESEAGVSAHAADLNVDAKSTLASELKSGIDKTSVSLKSTFGQPLGEGIQSDAKRDVLGKSEPAIVAEENEHRNDKLTEVSQAKQALTAASEERSKGVTSDKSVQAYSAAGSHAHVANNISAMIDNGFISENMHFSEPVNGRLTPLSATNSAGEMSLRSAGDNLSSMHSMIQRFSPVMQQQLLTMVSQGVQQAEIRLDPAELGQMMVKIQVQGDTTQVQFQVTQLQTRELIEQALPRLKEMLAEQGMQLSDGQVSYQGSQNESPNQNQQGAQQEESTSDRQLAMDTDGLMNDRLMNTLVSDEAGSSVLGIDYYA